MITRRNLLLASLAGLLPKPLLAQTCAAAPKIAGTGPRLNSAPLSLSQLRGKVVLVEFWTFGCHNCRNVMPYVKQGLVVVGVHTPEFAYEADPERVRNFLCENGITHPVVLDNDSAIWNRLNNRYWPAMYLLNKSGELATGILARGGIPRLRR